MKTKKGKAERSRAIRTSFKQLFKLLKTEARNLPPGDGKAIVEKTITQVMVFEMAFNKAQNSGNLSYDVWELLERWIHQMLYIASHTFGDVFTVKIIFMSEGESGLRTQTMLDYCRVLETEFRDKTERFEKPGFPDDQSG